MFLTEARVLSQLGVHDQIPQLFDHFEENKEFFLVQSYIEGRSLSEELPVGETIPDTQVASLLKDILQVLVFVHQNHVIHRDIKPPNLIRRTSDKKLVLIDFGAVKEIRSQVVTAQGRTRRTVVVGSNGYMPSEQSIGSPTLSSDVYAVGMIGIQALTGIMPEQLEKDENLEIVWHDFAKADPKLVSFLDKMVLYDCRQRFPSAEEALKALEGLSHNNWMAYAPTEVSTAQAASSSTAQPLPVKASPLVASSPLNPDHSSLQQNPQMRWLLSGVVGVLLLLLAAGGYLLSLNKTEQPSPTTAVEPPQSPSAQATQTPKLSAAPQQSEYTVLYNQAVEDINSPGHQQAFEKLYLASEAAIANNEAPAMLARLNQDTSGVFQRMATGHPEWQVLVNALEQSDGYSYTLSYARAKLNITEGDNHQREWSLLFAAAHKAIANNQTQEMLTQLRKDALGRFKNFVTGHTEWQQLIDALEKQDQSLLPT